MRYSYSALKMWLTCPRQFWAKYVARTWPPFHETPATKRGMEAHQHLEDYLRGKQDSVPGWVWTPEGLLDRLRDANAVPEKKLEYTVDGVPFVAYIDVYIRSAHSTLMIDWKTGKFRPDEMQADVYAMLDRADKAPTHPVKFSWVYIDQKIPHAVEVDRHAKGRVFSVVQAVENDTTYAPKPGWPCRWCPESTCEYYQGEKS